MKIKNLLVGAMMLIAPMAMQAARIIVLADVHVVPGNECEKKLKFTLYLVFPNRSIYIKNTPLSSFTLFYHNLKLFTRV